MDKIIYMIVGVIALIIATITIVVSITRNPQKKISFCDNAKKNGCETLATCSCYMMKGDRNLYRFWFEYCFPVNEKMYFFTISIDLDMQTDSDKLDNYSASQLIRNKDYAQMFVYYDKNNPNNNMIREEIFTSKDALKREKTSKKNKYRDIKKDWIVDGPIDLRF